MRLGTTFLVIGALSWSGALLAGFANTQDPPRVQQDKQSCSDPWGDCKRVVKVVGREGDCVTFSCETGTKNEHIIRTNDDTGKKTLFDRAKPEP